MSEQTAQQAQQPAAELNGQGAAPPPEDGQAPPVPSADKALGIITIGLGLFLILAGADRLTGGLVTATVTGLFAGAGDG